MIEKFETHNDTFVCTEGTAFKDRIETSLAVLVDVFGDPHLDAGGGAYWGIRFPDGELATVYNYTRYADGDCPVWNIGGNDGKVVSRIKRLIKWRGYYVD